MKVGRDGQVLAEGRTMEEAGIAVTGQNDPQDHTSY